MTALLLLAALAAAPAAKGGTAMVHLKADFEHTLIKADGTGVGKTMPKTWYFEVPASRADDKHMEELLHRIFWDANVKMRYREPGDHAFLKMVSFKTHKVDPTELKTWKGGEKKFGWLEATRDVVWELTATYIVDEGGNYDGIGGNDYSELLMHRMLQSGQVDEKAFVAFFDAYNPKTPGKTVLADREKRFKNLTEIRKDQGYRKKPGEKPVASGPIDSVAAPK